MSAEDSLSVSEKPNQSDDVELAPSAPPEQALPQTLPLLPLRDAVAFPGVIMPLTIGREKSRKLVSDVLSGDRIVGVVTQRDSSVEEPELNDLYRIGTACQVLKLLRLPDGAQSIVVHGIKRFGVEDILAGQPYLRAKVNYHQAEPTEGKRIEALLHSIREAAYRVIDLSPNVPEEVKAVLGSIEGTAALADFVAANLSVGVEHKQELLETFDIEIRLGKIHQSLTSQLDVLDMSRRIQEQAKQSIDESQRHYWLQEQLKAIQRELGQSDDRSAEMEELRKLIRAARMPEPVEAEALRQVDRLERIPAASPEYSVISDHVRLLSELPWSVSTPDNLDIKRAEKILNEDHHGLEKVKSRILEFLSVRSLKPDGRGPILCFAGPPGVGKTSLGQSIARALGRKFIRLSLGGMHDEAEIRGHRRTYIGAMPGRVIQELRKCGANNPVFMLDEIDKVGSDFRGDPASALLEVLDPAQNSTFADHYLDAPFDLSKVLFIATANYLEPVPPALRDRMELIEIAGYTQSEKLVIAKNYLVPRQLSENGLKGRGVEFADDAVSLIIGRYTREAGVRELERQIGAVCRGIAARIAKGSARRLKVTPRRLQVFLGPERFQQETVMRTSVPGVATGLAYTPVGGEIIFIEASKMPGKGGLILTGQIGDVMRESAQAAFTILRSRAQEYGVAQSTLADSDFHIHVPAGAVPKDGPSAGVAIFTALISLCSDRSVRSDVAMTGEITLRGLVLPIGGVKEKTLAAKRAGIECVILPQDNRKDLTDVPAEVKKSVEFVFVKNVDQVLKRAIQVNGDSEKVRSKAVRKTKRSSRRRKA